MHALLLDRRAYEAYQPAQVGACESQFVLGKHTGSAALRHILADQGISLPGELTAMLLSACAARRSFAQAASPRSIWQPGARSWSSRSPRDGSAPGKMRNP